jgi:hypothetical protein
MEAFFVVGMGGAMLVVGVLALWVTLRLIRSDTQGDD